MPSTTYSISDLAKEFSVTTRTIRHYEELGLLQPARNGQTRIYSKGDRTRLRLILRGKRLGFSLDESREIIDMYHPQGSNSEQLNKLLQTIAEQKARLESQRRDIEAMLNELNDAEQQFKTALASEEN